MPSPAWRRLLLARRAKHYPTRLDDPRALIAIAASAVTWTQCFARIAAKSGFIPTQP
jgi:hypothetical protein